MTRAEGTVRLAESVTTLEWDGGVRMIRGAHILRIRGPGEILAAAVSRLRAGVNVADLGHDPHEVAVRQLVRKLDATGWLAKHDPEFGQGTSVERQIGYLTLFGSDAAAMQQRIREARVAVLGAGAVGALLAQHLVGAGVRELWLIDDDRVARHNLNRQFLAGSDDVGDAKTRVVARALLRLAPDTCVHAVDRRVSRPEDLNAVTGPVSLLLVAADTPPDIPDIAWRWARPRGVAMCSAAVGLGTGYWGPLLVPHLGHCWTCFEGSRTARLSDEEKAAESAARGPVPYSFGPANTTVSALCAHEVIRFIATGDCAVINRRGHIRFADSATSFLPGAACECDGKRGDGV